jgi:hypothetical protein
MLTLLKIINTFESSYMTPQAPTLKIETGLG